MIIILIDKIVVQTIKATVYAGLYIPAFTGMAQKVTFNTGSSTH